MSKKVYLTKEGFKEFTEQLDYLRKVKRPKVIEELAYAAELGDLRENSEYDAVIHEQAIVEGKILDLEHILDNAEVIEHPTTNKVGLGSRVKVLIDKEEEEYIIVSPCEADVHKNKISSHSIIGSSLLNKHKGDKVNINNASAVYTMLITNISE